MNFEKENDNMNHSLSDYVVEPLHMTCDLENSLQQKIVLFLEKETQIRGFVAQIFSSPSTKNNSPCFVTKHNLTHSVY